MEQKDRVYRSLSLLFFNLFITSLVLVGSSYFSILVLDIIISPDIVFGIGMFFGFLALVFWENSKGRWKIEFNRNGLDGDEKVKKIESENVSDDNLFFKAVPYLFLFFLLVIAVNQFWKNPFLTAQSLRITILAITFGAVTFWRNRERVEKEIEDEKNAEEEAEKKRAKEFGKKFPRLKFFDFGYGVGESWKAKRYGLWFLRVVMSPFVWLARLPYSLTRWAYKEGWWYGLTTLFLIIIGFSIRLYRLGNLSLWWDELITGMYVTRILEVGVPLFPSGLGYYWRGVAYHYFVSVFTFIGGNNEFWLRFPSVLFGMGIVITAFFLAKKINKRVALVVLAWLVFSTYNIEYSRFARFYVMNTFLFMIAIWFFWEGFFNNKLKYKILSVVTFFIMMHTVQFGMIFMSLWGAWFIFLFKNFRNGNFNKKINYMFFIISLLIFRIDNIFIKIFNIDNELDIARDIAEVVAPVSWDYFQFPKWNLINFFNQNYLPLVIILFNFVVVILLFIKVKNNKSNFNFLSYIGIITILSILIYEVGSRGVIGARIFLFAEALIVILAIFSIYITIKTKNKIMIIMFFFLFIIFSLNISPNFYQRISINYGDDVSSDPFRTTNVAAYRADYKTTYEYLKNNKNNDDIWINVMSSNYYYYNDIPNYILNQNIRWNTNSFIDEDGNFINSDGSILISFPEDIIEIIKENKDKKVWLLVNGGSVNILSTTHVRANFLNFLRENENKVVYKSPDGISVVLLFDRI
jgi:hypothetical protein